MTPPRPWLEGIIDDCINDFVGRGEIHEHLAHASTILLYHLGDRIFHYLKGQQATNPRTLPFHSTQSFHVWAGNKHADLKKLRVIAEAMKHHFHRDLVKEVSGGTPAAQISVVSMDGHGMTASSSANVVRVTPLGLVAPDGPAKTQLSKLVLRDGTPVITFLRICRAKYEEVMKELGVWDAGTAAAPPQSLD